MLEHIMAWLRSQESRNLESFRQENRNGESSRQENSNSESLSGESLSRDNRTSESQRPPLIDEAIFSMGYQPDSIIRAYPSNICADMPFTCAVEPEPLGTAGALRFAASHGEIADTFLAMNGDIFCRISCAEIVEQHRRSGAEATIALTSVTDPSQFGVVVTDEGGRVLSFVEKPPKDASPSTWINAGIYVMEPSVLARIPDGRPVSLEREVFPQLAAEGTLFACQSEAAWLDVGTPESYIKAQFLVADSGQMLGAEIAADAIVERSVLLPNSRVASKAVVKDSIVGEGAVIGEGAVVEGNSVVADWAEVPPETRLKGARYPD